MTDVSDEQLNRWMNPPEFASPPGAAFYRQFADDVRSITSEHGHIEAMRRLRIGLVKALDPESDPQEANPALFESLASVDAAYRSSRRFRQEVIATRCIDNYLAYVSEMVAMLLVNEPRALRSNEQIRIADVLDHERMEDFIEWLADDRINRLSFKGFGEISEYVESRLGLPLVRNDGLKRRLVRAIATRNLLIHRRGFVDRRFLALLDRQGFDTDGLVSGVRLQDCDSLGTLVCVLEAVAHFEQAASARFRLSKVPIEVEIFSPAEPEADGQPSTDLDPDLDPDPDLSSDL